MNSGSISVFLIINYLHEVATTVILSSAIVLRLCLKNCKEGDHERQYRVFKKVLYFCLGGIILTGIPRIITLSEVISLYLKNHYSLVHLLFKEIFILLSLVIGIFLWTDTIRLFKKG